MLKASVYLILVFNVLLLTGASYEKKYSAVLKSRLKPGEKLDIVVSFTSGNAATIKSDTGGKPPIRNMKVADALDCDWMKKYDLNHALKYCAGRVERNEDIIRALDKNVVASQGDVLTTLRENKDKGFEYHRQFWLSNILFVKQATPEIIKLIAEDSKVSEIEVAPILTTGLPDENPMDDEVPYARHTPSEAFKYIGCSGPTSPDCSIYLTNYAPDIRVATIDSGARHSHDYLKEKYNRGTKYGWHDALNYSTTEGDATGHGTFVLGLILGSTNDKEIVTKDGPIVGVDPAASWMSCKACLSRKCEFEHVMICLEWVACPTDSSRHERVCQDTPHVVAMPLMGEKDGYNFDAEFFALRELGIIPVIAAENTGVDCDASEITKKSNNAIRVGSACPYMYAGYGQFKPDLVAYDCEHVLSVSPFNDKNLINFNNPTIGCGYVAGAVALVIGNHPELTFEEVLDLLTKSASLQVLKDMIGEMPEDKNKCKGVLQDQIESSFFGAGLLNVAEALKRKYRLDEESKNKRYSNKG